MKVPRISSTIIVLIVEIFPCPMPGQASGPQAATSSKPNYQQVDGFQFEFLPIEFQNWKSERVPKLTIQENGTDIPFDIGPAHIKVIIRVKPSKLLPQSELQNYGDAKIHLIPLNDPTVPNFDKAYPDLSSCRDELLAIFKGVIPKVKPTKGLPDWNCVDVGQTIHSKVRLVETAWCKGLQYITEYTQEETGIDNAGLTFVFQGISKDGKFYVAAWIPVAHPSLPLHAAYLDKLSSESNDHYSARVEKHYEAIEDRLNKQPDESFVPSLQTLRRFIASFGVVQR